MANPSMDRAVGLKFPQALHAAAVQTQEDVEMLASLGAPRDRMVVTGNLASDLAPLRLNAAERRRLRSDLALPPSAPVVIFGSTHGGELDLVRICENGCRTPDSSSRLDKCMMLRHT
jgi:3-deoxy-D-manno-octulosonic-acid transferase